jgi:hypothetical protein
MNYNTTISNGPIAPGFGDQINAAGQGASALWGNFMRGMPKYAQQRANATPGVRQGMQNQMGISYGNALAGQQNEANRALGQQEAQGQFARTQAGAQLGDRYFDATSGYNNAMTQANRQAMMTNRDNIPQYMQFMNQMFPDVWGQMFNV